MKRLRIRTLIIIAAIAFLLVLALLTALVRAGRTPALLEPAAALVLFLLVIPLWWGGREVRKLKRHQEAKISPITAANIALAAQSAELVGSAILGYLGAQIAVSASLSDSQLMARQLIGAVVAFSAMLLLVIMAFVVEGWCLIDDDEDDEDRGISTRISGSGKARASGAATDGAIEARRPSHYPH